MKNVIKISDTSFSPIINLGTPNESGFYETSALKNNLSYFIKNDVVMVEDDIYSVPIIEVEKLEFLTEIEIQEERK